MAARCINCMMRVKFGTSRNQNAIQVMSALPTTEDLKRICRDRGLRLTEQRLEAFRALRQVGKPVSAYDLLPRLEKRLGKRLAPLTVYRALDFLVDNELAHKLASNHSYTLCDRPHTHHESVHLVCTECGAGEELTLGPIAKALDKAASERRFLPKRHIVELEGQCRDCSTA